FDALDKNILVIAQNEKKAKEYQNNINNLYEIASFYPASEINFYNIKSVDEDIKTARMENLISQSNNQKQITITTIEALLNKITPLDKFNNSFVSISNEDTVDVAEFIQTLINLNYNPTSLVENKGEYANRGSIIDFWPIDYQNPVRLELFDDEIDSIRIFDEKNQRTIDKIDKVSISPLNELIYDKSDFDKILENIEEDIVKLEKNIKNSNDQRLIDKFKQIQSYLENSMYVANWDLLNAYRQDNYETFIDYLSKDTIIIVDDISRIYDDQNDFYDNFLEDVTLQRDRGEVFNNFSNLLINSNDIYKKIENYSIINLTSILKRTKLFNPKLLLELKTIEAEHFNRKITNLAESLKNQEKTSKSLFFVGNGENKENLISALKENDILEISDDFKSKITVTNDSASEGYYLPDYDFYLFTEKEIYGTSKKKSKKKIKNKMSSTDIINYSDLDIGDYVVHENNGIGVYDGLEKIEVNNIQKDFIVINYKGNDK
ncbi:MAG: CarD family transcriptional regulator, partial [Anaerococcus sp.]|nr:CarD family transcriptional regulator [Anaerococcus sp.]